MEIAFFGHDASDAAVRRRAVAFADAGHQVTGFMMRRDEDQKRLWANVDLGRTYDAAYGQRLKAIYQGANIAAEQMKRRPKAELIYARNLDMLICAMLVRRKLGYEVPVIYECLDVHHMLSNPGLIGMALRGVERRLLRETRLLVFSSPAFEREYFAKKFPGAYTPYLLENRLVRGGELSGVELPARPLTPRSLASPPMMAPDLTARAAGAKLRIGWFGILRCARSLSLLMNLAAQYRDEVEIVLRGIPALTQVPDFHDVIATFENVTFGGAYQAPQDLASLYQDVDLVWAGDFYQAGYNSKWLLPNRLYEGGYFATPAIAPADSETGAWISQREAGFVLPEPLEVSLATLIGQILQNRAVVEDKANNLRALPEDTFVQPGDEIERLIAAALAPMSRGVAA